MDTKRDEGRRTRRDHPLHPRRLPAWPPARSPRPAAASVPSRSATPTTSCSPNSKLTSRTADLKRMDRELTREVTAIIALLNENASAASLPMDIRMTALPSSASGASCKPFRAAKPAPIPTSPRPSANRNPCAPSPPPAPPTLSRSSSPVIASSAKMEPSPAIAGASNASAQCSPQRRQADFVRVHRQSLQALADRQRHRTRRLAAAPRSNGNHRIRRLHEHRNAALGHHPVRHRSHRHRTRYSAACS